jgi:hypothetical protein
MCPRGLDALHFHEPSRAPPARAPHARRRARLREPAHPLHVLRVASQGPGLLAHARERGGRYRGTIRPQGDSIAQGRLHSWTPRHETIDGVPVERATVSVDGGMPQHGHGLPTEPRVQQRAVGDQLVQGMKFNMGGWWVVKFRVRSTAADDSLVFDLEL